MTLYIGFIPLEHLHSKNIFAFNSNAMAHYIHTQSMYICIKYCLSIEKQ